MKEDSTQSEKRAETTTINDIDPRLRLYYYSYDEEVLDFARKTFSVPIAFSDGPGTAGSATKKYIWARIAKSGRLHVYNLTNN